jgi:hypothetical protein
VSKTGPSDVLPGFAVVAAVLGGEVPAKVSTANYLPNVGVRDRGRLLRYQLLHLFPHPSTSSGGGGRLLDGSVRLRYPAYENHT